MEKAHYEFPARYDWDLTDISNTKAKAPWNNPTPTSRHFSPEEAKEIKRIVLDLKERGFFLGGSRDKLNDRYSFDSIRDWDFNSPYFGKYVQIVEGLENLDFKTGFYGDKEVGEYVVENFDKMPRPTNEYTIDNMFLGYWKHKVYPHITVIERYNLPLYIRAWECLDINLWGNYIWKSRPELLEKGETQEQANSRKVLTNLILNSLFEACKDPNIKDCM